MRDYKFKAVTKESRKWVAGDLSTNYMDGKVFIVERVEEAVTRWHEVYPETVSPSILQKAIGGTDVFLGDFLEEPEFKNLYEVVWIEEESAYALREQGTEHYLNVVDALSEDGEVLVLEVVGNKNDRYLDEGQQAG